MRISHNGQVIALGVGMIIIFSSLTYLALLISYSNEEIRLRNLIEAKQKDLTNEFDNLWKKIKQVAQVTKAERASLIDVYTSHAKARNSGGGMVMKWVKESIPNVTPDMHKQLGNIIIASRDRYTMQQKILIDMKRQHDDLLQTFPGNWILSDRQPIDIKIITSTRTKDTFDRGTDDNVDVMND